MLLGGYDNQANITNRLAMPVDVLADTAYVNPITGETLQFYFWDTNVLTIDAGEDAGTVVIGKFAYSGILDSMGAMIGNALDSSHGFTTGTVFTTQVPCDYNMVGDASNATLEQIAIALTENMANGEYCIDFRNGVLYGKKDTTGDKDTVAYKVHTQTTGGGTSIASTVNVGKIGGVAISVKNAAYAEPPLGIGVEYEIIGSLATDGSAAGDKVPSKGSAKGVPYVTLVDAAGAADLGASMNTLLGTIDADTGAIKLAVEIMDDWDGTAYTETLALATNHAHVSGLCYGIDANNGTPILAAMQVAVDNTTISGTPNTLITGGIYKAILDTYDDNDAVPFHFDVDGSQNMTLEKKIDATNDAISTQPVEPSGANTVALAASKVIKASAGTIYEFAGYNTGVKQVIQLHDAASLPADTAVPEVKFWVAADSPFSRVFPQGLSMGTGIVVCNSSTLSTKTIGGADCEFDSTFI